MRTKNKITWLDYFDAQSAKGYEPEQMQLAAFEDFFQTNNFLHLFFRHSAPYIYILDYKKRTYINASENIAGYKADSFLRGGLDHTLEIYDPGHLQLLNNEIFPDRLNFLADINPSEHKNYVFSFIQNVKNRSGEYESLLQRNFFLSDEHGNPLFSIGFLLNINVHLHHQPVIQTVDKLMDNGMLESKTIFQKSYYPYEEDKQFTKREKEVLQWMAEGLSSKMIADKMYLSEHTVINHRRNMQAKTSAPNAIALVSLAIRNGMI